MMTPPAGWTDYCVKLIATGFGIGCNPYFPGTLGTVLAYPVYRWGLSPFNPKVKTITLVILFLGGVYICGHASKLMGSHDPGGIVLDESAAFLAVLCLIPATWRWQLAGFVLFRFFDIVKPFPVDWIDANIEGGLGIMLDDMTAGVCTMIFLFISKRCIEHRQKG